MVRLAQKPIAWSLRISFGLLTLQHVLVGVVRDGEEMRGHLSLPLAPVGVDDLLGVDGQAPVRVHSHTEQAGVGLEDRGDKQFSYYLNSSYVYGCCTF